MPYLQALCTTIFSKEKINAEQYEDMRDFEKPVITARYYIFHTMFVCIPMYIFAVIVSELSEKSGLVSAIISGWKVFQNKPV
jgi:hypothetical protein